MEKYITIEQDSNSNDQWNVRFNQTQAFNDGAVKFRPIAGINPSFFHVCKDGDIFVLDNDDYSEFQGFEEASAAAIKLTVEYAQKRLSR